MFNYIAKLSGSRLPVAFTLVAFLLVAGFLSITSPELSTVTTNEESEFLPKNSESLRVLESIQSNFVTGAGIPAIIVIDSDNVLDSDKMNQVADYTQRLRSKDRPSALGQVLSPTENPVFMSSMISKDGSALQILATIRGAPADIDFEEAVDWLRSEASTIFTDTELSVSVTGPAGIITDAVKVFRGIDLRVTVTTVALVFILLLLVYRSPLLAIIPLLIIGVALTCARAIASLLTQNFGLALNDQVSSIMSVLLFGAGTDFTLFIVSRYREEWQKLGPNHRWQAMRHTMTKVGPAIGTSGGTTILAMLVLLWASNGSFVSLGPMLAMAVLVMLITALTVVPGVIVILGRAAFWPMDPFKAKSQVLGFWTHASALISRAGGRVLLIALLFLGAATLGSGLLRPNFGFVDGFPDTADSKLGYNILKEKFPPGDLAPITILIAFDSKEILGQLVKFEEFSSRLSDDPGVVRLVGPTRPNGKVGGLSSNELRSMLLAVEQSIDSETEWEKSIQLALEKSPVLAPMWGQLPRFLSSDGSIARFEITWDSDPYSNETISQIGPFRERVRAFAEQSGLTSADVLVGGESATQYDIKQATIRDLLGVGPLVLLVVWLILVALLKSLIAPTYLIFSILLSFGSAFGLSVLFFQYVLGQAGVAFENLMWMFVFLIALGADYNIYMMSRIQEEVKSRGIKEGIREAVARTGGVITSAGLILAGTFMVLFTLPLQPISQLGFGVALGVLIDTFVVRGFLVPSMVATVRHWSWWPNPMYKKLQW